MLATSNKKLLVRGALLLVSKVSRLFRMPNWQANYLALTGDREGMTGDTADDVPACHDTYWWFAPSCRDSKDSWPSQPFRLKKYMKLPVF